MKRYNLIILATLIVALLFSVACAPRVEVALASTPEPTVSVTAAPTATPSPIPTVEPTPTRIPQKREAAPGILKGQGKVEAEVNQRFEDFLNSKAEFTDATIKKTGFEQGYSNKIDIGCIDAYDETFVLQGVFLYYERVPDGEIFAFGVKNKDGNRIITLIEIPSQISINYRGTFTIWGYPDSSVFSSPSPNRFGRRDDIYYDFLKSLEGKALTIDLKTRPVSESSGFDSLDDNAKTALTESLDPKVEASFDYVTNVYFVDDQDHQLINASEYIKQLFEAEGGPIITVSTYSEFEEFVKNCDFSSIPSSLGVAYIIDG